MFHAITEVSRCCQRFLLPLLLGLSLSTVRAHHLVSYSLQGGQLSGPLEHMQNPNSQNLHYLVQRTRDDLLILTPNECFFPRLGLVLEGQGKIPDIADLNKGKSFERITKWDGGDSVEWGVWLKQPGEVVAKIWMSGTSSRDKFSVHLSDDAVEFSSAANKGTTPRQVAVVRLHSKSSGLHTLRIISEKKPSVKLALHSVELSGTAVEDGAVLRKRWRPAAAHAKFSSSLNPNAVRLWVMEMDAAPGPLGFYSPVTTPFGYYGPTWTADGQVNKSLNFSMWSYRRKQEEPPIEKLSHLVAVGDRNAAFGEFGHEGTGVKVRNWSPLEGRQRQRQLLALRLKPGETYDTYWSYFFAADERKWRFFAAGNKYHNGRPNRSLALGSFVEVPGAPEWQRTGPYVRSMRYRGWLMDKQGQWYPLDRMGVANVDKKTGLTYTDRGTTEDGRFYLQTGGWAFRRPTDNKFIELKTTQGKLKPEFLDSDCVKELTSVPSEIEALKLDRTTSSLRLIFVIRNLCSQSKVTVFWGKVEGLTFAERWEHSAQVYQPIEGINQWEVESPNANKQTFVRLLLENSEGRFWSERTIATNQLIR